MTLDGLTDDERGKALMRYRNGLRRQIARIEAQLSAVPGANGAQRPMPPGMREWASGELRRLEDELRDVPAR